jgi:hypothetical protein
MSRCVSRGRIGVGRKRGRGIELGEMLVLVLLLMLRRLVEVQCG